MIITKIAFVLIAAGAAGAAGSAGYTALGD